MLVLARAAVKLDVPPLYGAKNPFAFMELQDVQELSNFFERSRPRCGVKVNERRLPC